MNCQYPRDALPHVIDAYRKIMQNVFELITKDKTKTRENAAQLEDELISNTVEGSIHEEGADGMHEHDDVQAGSDSSADEEQWRVHDWFDFGSYL